MKIKEMLSRKPTLSFEFFPPKTEEGIPAVHRVIGRLEQFNPDFVSVTYGAGGGTRKFTEDIITHVKHETSLEAMAHLACAAQTMEDVHEVLVRLEQAGIENIIALRGDPPRGQQTFVPAGGEFAHATDLIEHARESFDFGIAAACYPEGHQESRDLESDIEYTKMKVDLGADFLITQLYYDNTYFFDFLDRARQAGIEVPILPGLLPIVSASQIIRIAQLSGATIPTELRTKLEKNAEDDRATREIGIEHATRQVEELWNARVDGTHFYVLNKSYSVSKILSNVGFPESMGPIAANS